MNKRDKFYLLRFGAWVKSIFLLKFMEDRDKNDNDEGATWSISSNGGISRSSHDDGISFQSKSNSLNHFECFELRCRSFGVKIFGLSSRNNLFFSMI